MRRTPNVNEFLEAGRAHFSTIKTNKLMSASSKRTIVSSENPLKRQDSSTGLSKK